MTSLSRSTESLDTTSNTVRWLCVIWIFFYSWWPLVYHFGAWRSWLFLGILEWRHHRPVGCSCPHSWLVCQVRPPTNIGVRQPVIGPGRPLWPPHHFFSRWSWYLDQYWPSVSPWMEGIGWGPDCSIVPRDSRFYRFGRPIFTFRSLPVFISWPAGACITSIPHVISGWCRWGLALSVLEGVLI